MKIQAVAMLAIAALVAFAAPAFAQPVDKQLPKGEHYYPLPGGGTLVTIHEQAAPKLLKEGFNDRYVVLCNPDATCVPVSSATFSVEGVLGHLERIGVSVIRGASLIEAARGLRPNVTSIDNGSGSYSSNYAPQSVTASAGATAGASSCSAQFFCDAASSPFNYSYGSSGVDSGNYYGSTPAYTGGKG